MVGNWLERKNFELWCGKKGITDIMSKLWRLTEANTIVIIHEISVYCYGDWMRTFRRLQQKGIVVIAVKEISPTETESISTYGV